jgi:hypothetical protein
MHRGSLGPSIHSCCWFAGRKRMSTNQKALYYVCCSTQLEHALQRAISLTCVDAVTLRTRYYR